MTTPKPPSPSGPAPEDPLAEAGRAPLHAAIASARGERRGGVSPRTLVVASAASAAASFAASHLWGAGTVLSAALTPLVVALVSEFLRRPVDRVSATAQRVGPIPIIGHPPGSAGAEPAARRPRPAPGDAGVDQGAWAPVTYEGPAGPGWRPRWRLVLATGLLAFAIVVAFYTIPDLLVGHSITGAGGSTTFFPGAAQSSPNVGTVSTQTTTAPTRTVTTTVPTTTVVAPTTNMTTSTGTTATAPTLSTPTDTTSTSTTTTATNPASTAPSGP